jgi:hypothetical protein
MFKQLCVVAKKQGRSNGEVEDPGSVGLNGQV